MRFAWVALVSGLLFGFGLVLSGMTQASKVIGFLDVTGAWDPSLAFVMIGAIGVHALAYRRVHAMPSPWLGGRFGVPTRADIDARLIIGAALFGVGWGLAGYCPGPALASISTGSAEILIFSGAMLAGMALFQIVDRTLLHR